MHIPIMKIFPHRTLPACLMPPDAPSSRQSRQIESNSPSLWINSTVLYSCNHSAHSEKCTRSSSDARPVLMDNVRQRPSDFHRDAHIRDLLTLIFLCIY